AVVDRLEGKALTFPGERGLDLGERRARPGRDDQFARLVERDAGEACDGEGRRALHRAAEAGARAAAGDGHRQLPRGGIGEDGAEFGLVGWLQKVGQGAPLPALPQAAMPAKWAPRKYGQTKMPRTPCQNDRLRKPMLNSQPPIQMSPIELCCSMRIFSISRRLR